MYNDRNRQNCNCVRQTPLAVRLGADVPRLDADQGGRRCDGTLGRTSRERGACDLSPRDRAGSEHGRTGWGLQDHPLAMVYSPYQYFRDTYTPDVALSRGTLFAELDLPFEGAGNKRNGGCAR